MDGPVSWQHLFALLGLLVSIAGVILGAVLTVISWFIRRLRSDMKDLRDHVGKLETDMAANAQADKDLKSRVLRIEEKTNGAE